MNQTTVSVIIPTCDDDLRLEWLLEGLCRQSYKDFEVIVANDNGPLTTQDLVAKYAHRLDIQHVLLDKPKTPGREQRAGATRNFGVKHSKGELLIFFDTDIVPDRDVVESHVKFFDPGISLIGYRRMYPEALVKPFPEMLSYEELKRNSEPDIRFSQYGKWKKPEYFFHYFGHQHSMASAVYCALGGNDERFEGWGEEDIDMGWRIAQYGIEIQPLWGISMGTHLGHPPRPRPPDLYQRPWRCNPKEPLVRNGGRLKRLVDGG